jgi:hypothetical protein
VREEHREEGGESPRAEPVSVQKQVLSPLPIETVETER